MALDTILSKKLKYSGGLLKLFIGTWKKEHE